TTDTTTAATTTTTDTTTGTTTTTTTETTTAATTTTRSRSRPPIDPETTTVLLFPGQGSQFVGMGRRLVESRPQCREVYEAASSILGYDLLRVCLEGPQSELDRTEVCQPAVMVTSLAAVQWLQEENPQAIERCVTTAGFSVGEITALVFAGVLDFEDAVYLIKVRAEGMQMASEVAASGMMTVMCGPRTQLGLAMEMAREVCRHRHQIEAPVCQVANYLYPECKVIAGHDQALSFIADNKSDFGIRRTKRLPVSGAFHTRLMGPCIDSYSQALRRLTLRGEDSLVPVYSNVKGTVYDRSAKSIQKLLRQHLTKPVKWEQILHDIYSRAKAPRGAGSGTVPPATHGGVSGSEAQSSNAAGSNIGGGGSDVGGGSDDNVVGLGGSDATGSDVGGGSDVNVVGLGGSDATGSDVAVVVDPTQGGGGPGGKDGAKGDRKGPRFPHTYEVGPGKQLGIFLRCVNHRAYMNYHKVDV
ncbi:hypothetical protein Ahia01_001328300, partial [Argonauta hians]